METSTVVGLWVFFACEVETTISSNMLPLPPPGSREPRLPAVASPRFVAGCGSGACYSALAAPPIPGDDERCSDTKTGVRSYHNPHHQGKGKRPKDLAAHQEQDEHGEKS